MKLFKLGSFVTVIALFFSLSIPQSALAQSPVDFGIRGGVNSANFSDVDGDPDSRTGLIIGGYLNFGLPLLPFSLQPEATYSQKGAEFGSTTIKLDYIEVPILAKFSFAPGPASPHIYAGPYVGFVLNSEAEDSGVSIEVDNAQTDFGGIIGAGLDINAGVIKVDLGGRYGLGFVDAFDGGQGKNSVFSIVAGISF